MNTRIGSLPRRAFLGSLGIAGLTLAACGGSSSGDGGGGASDAATLDGTITGTYDMHVQGYDWGCGVDKVTVTLSAPLDTVAPEDFVVSEHKQATDWTAEDFPVIEADFERTVTAASIDGNTLELDLYCSPADGSPFLYSMATSLNTWCDPYELNIGIAEGASLTSDGAAVTELSIEPVATGKTTSADAWTISSFECSDGTVYPYAAFDPAEESKTLVVWLHGAGEGGTLVDGTDPYVTVLANKVVALSEDEFQTTVGGAHIVAPQCPTFWMDIGDKTYITAENSDEIASIYTESLEEFIDSYAETVGAEKVVLAGCSNGGFMTFWMAIDRPDRYAAIVPICEAVYDTLITEEQIQGVKDVPSFFIYCENDDDVIPSTCEEPTIERLKAAGMEADKLHVFTCEKVVDTSGEFTMEDGSPYEYATHWSWIYFDNNEAPCNEDGLPVFDFIAECVK